MSPSTEDLSTVIPTIDINAFRSGSRSTRSSIAGLISSCCTHFGFLFINDRDVSPEVIADLRSTSRTYFALPYAQKLVPRLTSEDHRGYMPIGTFTNAESRLAEQCEVFKIYRGPTFIYKAGRPPTPENLWPQDFPQLRYSSLNYWQALEPLRVALLELFALALGLDETALEPYFSNPLTNMSLLRYPPTEPSSAEFGMSPHTDSDVLTILHPDEVGGLMIQNTSGEWIQLYPQSNEFVVNVGDMMELWSGGRFRSTPHFVRNHSGKERISFPYFVAPNPEVTIRALKPARPGFNIAKQIHVGSEPEYIRAMSIGRNH